ncbi:NADH dehydrogenase [ubiquinone] 1 beta subcomplex subunit 11, mitochondrial [Syngnathus typhle]
MNVSSWLFIVRQRRSELQATAVVSRSGATRSPTNKAKMLGPLSRLGTAFPRLSSRVPVRCVSQSKPSGAAGATAVTELQQAAPSGSHGEVSPFVKNPDYHGFSTDPVVDQLNMRVGFFFGISVCLVIGGTFLHYLPDHGMRQWARREAERVILQKEMEGLPLIDENYYDPSKIILPSAEEE